MSIERERIKALVEKAGGEFIGIKKLFRTTLVWFNCPETKTTKAVNIDGVTVEIIKAKWEGTKPLTPTIERLKTQI